SSPSNMRTKQMTPLYESYHESTRSIRNGFLHSPTGLYFVSYSSKRMRLGIRTQESCQQRWEALSAHSAQFSLKPILHCLFPVQMSFSSARAPARAQPTAGQPYL